MKSIKKFLKKLDLSGMPLTFKYKSKDKYSISLGEFIILIFCLIVLYLGIYYIIQFINKKNFTTIYYTANIPKTETIKLKDSNVTFSLGLDCQSKGRFKADDILKLQAKYISLNKSTEGIYKKKTTFLSTHFCTHKDFLNSHNDSFDRLTLNKYQCLDDYNSNLEGIYSDQIFTYYEFSVVSKYDTPENLNNIEEFLFASDCKMKIIYIEKSIDLNNYMEPIKSYLYDVFVQLNPTLYIKRNMFFVNQYLTNDDDLLGFIDDADNSIITSLYSRYEEYSLYLGLNRSITKPPDYDKYAKIILEQILKKQL